MTRDEIIRELRGMLFETEWRSPEHELPTSEDFVLGLLSGKVSGILCEHAPFIVSWVNDGLGWMLVNSTDKPGDEWEVVAWMPIPEWRVQNGTEI